MGTKHWILKSLCFCLLFPVMQAGAQTNFFASLDGSQEVGPTNSTATGTATFVLNAAQDRLTIDLTIMGLDLDGLQTPGITADNVTGLHIHRAPAGINGGVVFGMIGINNDTNGDLIIDPAAGTIFSAWDLAEGNATTLAAELPNLLAEGLYINVHTTAFPGGEIRGQIVPEPAALGLLAAGGLALLRKRRSIQLD
ncbi:MAG: CHRD domain protein [Planctomycetes bacterium ADurb.Bin412]|nr:MAG: CHRD domain protein [Planctomycetes bacterium ADurb.Bin412]